MGDSPPNAAITASRGLDFYTYVNHSWQDNAKILPYDSSFSVSDEIETRVENALFSIIEKLHNKNPDSPFSQLAHSIINANIQVNSVYDIQRLSNLFECMTHPESIGHMIGKLNRIQSNAPISFVIANDRYIPNKRCVYIYEPKLGLPEKDLYKKGVNDKILASYTNVLRTIGKMMRIEELESAVTLEASLLPVLSAEDDREDVSFSYEPYTLADLKRNYPQVPWIAMMTAWGLSPVAAGKATYIITNKAYVRAFDRMFKTFTIETWRVWMRAQTFVHYMKYLPPPFDDMHFNLFGRQLQGTTQKMPQKFLMLSVLKEYIQHDLGHAYIENAVSPKLKETAGEMIRALRIATLKRIRGLGWMTDATKEKAIEKCKAMLFQIAYPDKWESELKHVKIDGSRMLLNVWNLAEYDTKTMLSHVGRGKINEKNNWEDGVFEVNAYYYSDKNMMVVPAGILQSPFFDVNRSKAWNLGGIGAAVGHEITHGFDDEGRLYDKTGVMKNWWSPADIKKYKEVTRALVDIFSKETYMGGKVNGEHTLSENIADLGGVSIALEALEMVFAEDGYNAQKKKEAYKDFFTSYAVSWRNKDRPKKAKQSLVLDKHAPATLRVNLIVRQFAEFYAAFDINEGDPGYIPADRRIQLW